MSLTSTPTDYSNLCTGRLAQKISPTTATGFIVTADTFTTPAGTGSATWPTGPQVWKISRKTRTTSEVEFVGVETASQSGSTVTTGTVNRYLPTNGSSLTSQGDGITFPAGSVVELVWHAYTAEKVAYKDVANTFSATQTISGTNELNFNSSATAIWKDGSGNLSLKDAVNGTKTLSDLASAVGTDEKAKISSNDTTQGYLNGKIVAGAGITLTENNDGSNETLSVIATNSVATGHTGLSTITSGGLLLGAGTSNMSVIGPGSIGQVPRSDGTTLAMARVPFCAYTNTSDSNDISSGGSYTLVDFNTSYTIPANDLASGTMYTLEAHGIVSTSSDLGGKWGIKVGSNVLKFNDASAIAITSAGGTHVWTLRATIICRSTGASGTIQCSGELDVRTSTGTTIWKNEILVPNSTSTVDTTGTLTFCPQFGWQTDSFTRVCKVKNISIYRI